MDDSGGETGNRTTSRPSTTKRIVELDGLRGLAIIIIATYHVWFNEVSGGVDIFLLLTGFFITTGLVRRLQDRGNLGYTSFLARIMRKILPTALVVAAACLIMTAIWVPKAKWSETLGDIVGVALNVGNWRFAEQSVDYLSSNNGASIVQHYWSLSMQFQFYLVWPLLLGLIYLFARRIDRSFTVLTAIGMSLLLVASLAYAQYAVDVNQAYAYFDTRARLWQFALGALLALTVHKIRPFPGAWFLSWIGVFGLIATGMVTDSRGFPGVTALLPMTAAALIVVSAAVQPGRGAGVILSSRPMLWLGDLAFTLYLWHWPVLVCYLTITDRSVATPTGGIVIIALSLALAVATRWLMQVRLPATGWGQTTNRSAYGLAAGCLAVVLAGSGVFAAGIQWQRQDNDKPLDPDTFPGAAALSEDIAVPPADFSPSTLVAPEDRLPELSGECNQSMVGSEVVECEFGAAAEDAEREVVMYGASKIWHWFPAMRRVAQDRDWHLTTYIKNACLITPTQPNDTDDRYVSCNAWNEKVTERIVDRQPDMVFVMGSRIGYDPVETFPDYAERWKEFTSVGIEVAAIRDTPSPRFDIPTCVDVHGAGDAECEVERSSYYPDASAFARWEVPEGVHKIDLIDFICGATICSPVVGNVLVYRDDAHLTASYARTLAEPLEDRLVEVLERE